MADSRGHGDGGDRAGDGGGWRWPLIIIGLLTANAIGCLVVIWIAVSDPSDAVEPGYDQAALRWDEEKAARLASDTLGWSCRLTIGAEADVLGQRALTIALHDHEGEPVRGAAVKLTLFHHARANDRVVLVLEPGAAGRYSASARFGRAGLWEMCVRAQRADDRYMLDEVFELDDGGAIVG